MKRVFPWQRLTEEAQVKEIQRMHRVVFGTEEGKQVLTMLLEDLYYFDVAATPEQVALKNYATRFIRKLGDLENIGATESLLDAIRKQEP